jgi:hypothetical protein
VYVYNKCNFGAIANEMYRGNHTRLIFHTVLSLTRIPVAIVAFDTSSVVGLNEHFVGMTVCAVCVGLIVGRWDQYILPVPKICETGAPFAWDLRCTSESLSPFVSDVES